MSKRFDEKVVWITGGGTGIGKAMAHEFAAEGASVAVSGRRQDRLDETVAELEEKGGRALAIPCDVTDDALVRRTADTVVERLGALDVSVANAGFGVSGRIEETSAEEWRRQLDVNVVGAASTIRWSLPHLRQTGGRMVLMGSVSGFVPTPGSGPYNASKYAVRAMGQVLSMELDGSGVSCTTIHPGFVESEIGQVDNQGQYRDEWEDRRPQAVMWSTDRAARTIVNAVYRRKREYVFTGHGKLAAFLGKHTPGLVHFALTKFGGD
jgi:NAD(P)-dependent dehydrogenase (short-subunit alcohol dehydrogenase family)